jgi:tyrosyl-tRNA synthetase
MLHGKEKTILAEKTAIDVFQNNSNSNNLPQIEISIDDKDIYLNDLILKMNFANSKSEIRKLVKNNGIKINRSLLTEELKVISIEDFTEDNEILVSLGKKKHFLIKLKN